MLRLTRRELETDPQGTAPVLDPTREGLRGRFPRATRLASRLCGALVGTSKHFQGGQSVREKDRDHVIQDGRVDLCI